MKIHWEITQNMLKSCSTCQEWHKNNYINQVWVVLVLEIEQVGDKGLVKNPTLIEIPY